MLRLCAEQFDPAEEEIRNHQEVCTCEPVGVCTHIRKGIVLIRKINALN
jgi:hypothetical protein